MENSIQKAVFFVLVHIVTSSVADTCSVTYGDSELIACSNQECLRPLTYTDILSTYPRVFYSVAEYAQLANLTYEIANSMSDDDQCCPTVSYFDSTTYTGLMHNAYGELCYIISSILGSQQFTHIGACGQGGYCNGRCQIESTMHWLLVFKCDPPGLSFEPFTVPTYCSCKNIK